ncbi:hypothetical protein ACHAWF_010993, partial [Thalassiosira exigua]
VVVHCAQHVKVKEAARLKSQAQRQEGNIISSDSASLASSSMPTFEEAIVSHAAASKGGGDAAPSCWICLDEGPDVSGRGLVRDCSCRGQSGHAHLSCLVAYAERMSAGHLGAGTRHIDTGKFCRAWSVCPNCRQSYERDLARSMAEECAKYVEAKHPGDHRFEAHAIHVRMRLDVRTSSKESHIRDAKRLIALVEMEKEEVRKSSAGEATTAEAFKHFELTAYDLLGLFAEHEGTKQSLREAVGHYEKCRDVYRSMGLEADVKHAEANIARARAKCGRSGGRGAASWAEEDDLDDRRKFHEEAVEEFGGSTRVAMVSLLRLAEGLIRAHCRVEAMRALEGLVVEARRKDGDGHPFTREVEECLAWCKKPRVVVRGRLRKRFWLLGRAGGKERYTVRGPIQPHGVSGDQKTFVVHVDQLRPTLGTVVICHGLEGSMAHLNGKLGDVRSREDGAHKYTVHFEDKNLEPYLVHPKNMIFVFQLPPKKERTAAR